MKWIFSLFFFITACSAKNSSPMTPEEAPVDGQYRYLALGDSYTIGESVSVEERWCVQLTEMLRKEGIKIATPEVIARTGWTTAELTEGIKNRNPKGPYNLVSLLIGVNNQYRGQSLEQYRADLQDLLQQAIGFAGGNIDRVFMLSIPDWGVTPFARGSDQVKISSEIDAFNQVAQQECEKLGIPLIDITSLSRTARTDASLIANDELHFSGKMYLQWAEKVLPTAQRLLK